MSAYYNEIEPYAAEWLRNLIRAGLIAGGDVDTRSIVDVDWTDIVGYRQCHFFAGIGGWSYALRLAGWPDDRPIWTGSCPCQPFSVAGKGAGVDDPRHLWPHFFRLIRAHRPPVVMGEQVAGAAGYGWFDGVGSDLEGEGYACRAVDVPACAVDAPHIRSRLYWVAVADADCGAVRHEPGRLDGAGRAEEGIDRDDSFDMGDTGVERLEVGERVGRVPGATLGAPAWQDAPDAGQRCDMASADLAGEGDGRLQRSGQLGGVGGDPQARVGGFWSDAVWLTGADGKARRAQSGLSLLAHGIPARVGRLRAYGNAIVPQLAAEVIAAFMECAP